jgi:arsenate reductase (glutaredoxin)
MSAYEVTIFHNPACGTSRNVLGMIRDAGVEPEIIEYLKNPPSRAELEKLLARAGLTVREILRKTAPPYAEMGLDDPALSEDALFAAIARHPVLIERPIVASPKGVRLCRPKEKVLDLMP